MWVTYGTTESGDNLTVIIWKYKPTNEEIDNEYRKYYEWEYDEIGCVNWNLDEAYVIEKKEEND